MTRLLLILKMIEAVLETVLKLIFYTAVIYVCWKAFIWLLTH